MTDLPTSLLPPAARGATISSSDPVPRLFPAEADLIARAIPRRQREFARGRGAARAALAALGIPAAPVGVGHHREPLWPPGVVGSISHCAELAMAAVASRERLAALGVDVEPASALPPEVRIRVLSEDGAEARALEEATGIDTVGFGAKECIHKAIHPQTGVWLDFHDVRLSPTGDAGTLRAEAARPGLDPEVLDLLGRLEIRWVIHGTLVFTSAWAVAD